MQSCWAANAIFSPEIFWGNSTGNPPKMGPKKSIFWTAQARELHFFAIRRYLTDKYFDIVWGCHPPPGDPQKSIFWMAQVRVPVCYDISRYLTDKYFDIVWGCHPLGTPQKSIFWTAQLFWYQEIFNWQLFWLYFFGVSIIRYFWIIADFTVAKSTFERHSITFASIVHWVCWQTPI